MEAICIVKICRVNVGFNVLLTWLNVHYLKDVLLVIIIVAVGVSAMSITVCAAGFAPSVSTYPQLVGSPSDLRHNALFFSPET